jgi:hypothetical protein
MKNILHKTFLFYRYCLLFILIFFLNICLKAQVPANDNCGAAVLVTSTLVNCTSPVNGTLNNSTASLLQEGGTPSCGTAWAVGYDVWYRFVAVTTTHTVSTSNFGGNYWNRQIHIYSACPTAPTGAGFIACGVTSVTATTLTIGNTYYVRVSDSWTAITTGGEFTICITHPLTSGANNTCATAFQISSNNACNPTTGNLLNANFAVPNGPAGLCATANPYDVWFRFTATSTTQTINVSIPGSSTSLSTANTYVEAFSGVCGTLTSLGCQNVATRQTLTGLTIGTNYYVRVFVKTNPNTGALNTWNFDICVQSQPANDECLGAVILNSNPTCTNTAGTLDLSTASTAPLGCFVVGTYYDVWYKFVAVTPTHTITLSSLGSAITAPRIQLYSGNCGTLTSVSCSITPTLTQTGLTVGNIYYVRVANFATTPYGTGTAGTFNICITHTNDDCIGSQLLIPASTCNNVTGTLLNATPNASILPTCGNANSAEVWFRFVATSPHPTVTLSNLGANLSTAGARLQLFSGTCSSLTPVTGLCGTSPLVVPNTTPGLLVNSTYYVRVTTNTNTGTPIIGAWNFDICITNPNEAVVDYGKSYVNITDRLSGGTIDPGDTLEIRATLVVALPNYIGAPTKVAIDSLAYYDTLTVNKGYRLVPNSMALRTNEGKLFRPTNSTYYTDLSTDADAAWMTTAGAGTDTALQINMGDLASRSRRGKLSNQSKPFFGANVCIIIATYRVTVTGGYGTKIKYGGGAFRYRDTITNTAYTINFPTDSLVVFASPGACPDAISPTNIIGDESNGTFGFSNNSPTHIQSRPTNTTKYSYQTIASGGPNDYFYAVTNNTSLTGSTSQIAPKNNNSPTRVFGVFDISGDHTNATNTAKGNKPCDLTQPVSATNPCGYMLAVNASFRSDVAFEYNFTGACTDTYYEISAWVKNICSLCGSDSTGKGNSDPGYIPTAPGDSSGVRPNLAFLINGLDYYNTGDILHQGVGVARTASDTVNGWVRRSFVFKTDSTQNNFRLTIRNNAPGGGGNDWVLDDISIRTCFPNMTYSPSLLPPTCAGSSLTIRDTVRSYYNTYKYYKWQRFNGSIWVDIAGTASSTTPVLIGGFYQFVASYVIPPSMTTPSNNGDRYRLMVATNTTNLNNGCGYSDIIPIQITVNICIDIDDDNDGIPDYVETNNPVALQYTAGTPNWNYASYAGRIDNNFDNFDDRFDAGADADNDGVPNFRDIDFTFEGPFVDSNSDGVNDRYDRDLDGIINQYDLDSDNDGIPDVVESLGADTNGDGIIDGYSDGDNDGFSNNVDSSAIAGPAGSGIGLGAINFDNDNIPNYLDLDSDNDGIPDAIEVFGLDANNDGLLDAFVDANADGLNDNYINATALLRTAAAISATNGRASGYPFKNFDSDLRPNAYDVDSDGDGIVDVIEAGYSNPSFLGWVVGPYGADGWSDVIDAQASLNNQNTDGRGNPNYLDIDSDDDGIPDQIEGQPTANPLPAGYTMPLGTDADADGLDTRWDNRPLVFGGTGIVPINIDGDLLPDYIDLDTDADGQPDIVEGNDFNMNNIADDNVTLTLLDTDGDGLDNRFDSSNATIKGTSYNLAIGGYTTGDPAPGTRAPVSRKNPAHTDRAWRYAGAVLPVQILTFTGKQQGYNNLLNWLIITKDEIERFEVERSVNNVTYSKIGAVTNAVQLNTLQQFNYIDDVSSLTATTLYYRIKIITKNGEVDYSNYIVIGIKPQANTTVTIAPNPATTEVNIKFTSNREEIIEIRLVDNAGRIILKEKKQIVKGSNTVQLSSLGKLSNGLYLMQFMLNGEMQFSKIIISHH